MHEENTQCVSSLKSQRQKEREARKPLLDSAQLWTILLDNDSRKLLGASAHSFRASCPVEGVQSPPMGKVGGNSHLTIEVMRHCEAMGYDTRTFPQWKWRETDRIQRWLQGARTDELMSFDPRVSCEECRPVVDSLRSIRDKYFHSWVVACKIDAAWIPTLIPFDASCPYTLALRGSLEAIYKRLIPLHVATKVTSNTPSSFVQGNGITSNEHSDGIPECDSEVFRLFLHHYIHFLYPGAGDNSVEHATRSILECVACWQSPARERSRSHKPYSPTGVRTSISARPSSRMSVESAGSENGCSVGSARATSLSALEQGGVHTGEIPKTVGFPNVLAVLTVLAEPYCFNERDASNFFEHGVLSGLIGSMQETFRSAVERVDRRSSNCQVISGAASMTPHTHHSGSANNQSLPNIYGLSEGSFASSQSTARDSSSTVAGRGTAVRVRVRPSSWLTGNAILTPGAPFNTSGVTVNVQPNNVIHLMGSDFSSAQHGGKSITMNTTVGGGRMPRGGEEALFPDIAPTSLSQQALGNLNGVSSSNHFNHTSLWKPQYDLHSGLGFRGSSSDLANHSPSAGAIQPSSPSRSGLLGLAAGRKASVTFVPSSGSVPTCHPSSPQLLPEVGGGYNNNTNTHSNARDSAGLFGRAPSSVGASHMAERDNEEYSGWFSGTLSRSDGPRATEKYRQ